MPATPASPPKRMTRARAKAVEEKAKKTTTTATKAATAGSRAAAATKASISKRKTLAEDEADASVPTARPARKVSTKPTLAQSRRGVTAAKLAAEAKSNEISQETTEVVEEQPKGQPRKNTISRDAPATQATTCITTNPTGPATRTRARAEPVKRATTSKKKVTFNDPKEDKENISSAAPKNNKATKSSTRPSRPDSTITALNTSRSAKKDAESVPSRMTPLSPKKETQVAKGNAIDNDDNASQPPNAAESEDELELDVGPCVSPSKSVAFSMASSPARRPPPSPFKDAMMASPRRLVLPQVTTDAGPAGSGTPAGNALSQSPRKLKILSPFKDNEARSPKEGSKSSLLNSPARRPASPIKGLTFSTPGGKGSLHKEAQGSMLASRSPLKFTPAKDTSAENKAAEVEAIKSRLMSIEEQAATLEDELFNAPSPFSPVKNALRGVPPKQDEHEFEPLEVIQGMDVDIEDLGTPQAVKISFEPRSSEALAIYEDESEDELSSDNVFHSTPAAHKTRLSSHFKPAVETPPPAAQEPTDDTNESLTVLAQRFGQWQAATPDPAILKHRQATRSVFSPLPHLARPSEASSSAVTSVASTPEPTHERPASFFDQAMPIEIHEDNEEDSPGDQHGEDDMISRETQEYFSQSQMSDASQAYGDENEYPPIDPDLLKPLGLRRQSEETCTPKHVFEGPPQVIHTVSKVPLKGCDDFDTSPLAVPKKRSQSLAGQLSPHANLELEAMRQIHPSATLSVAQQAPASPIASHSADLSRMVAGLPETPRRLATGSVASDDATVTATPRADAGLLKGAVVFVDVHTTEGADASGLFIDLLSQMGAKCVKSWNWNPRASSAEDSDGTPPTTPNAKIGITHVVFKDGGKRTMEKVREAHGRVVCVGVGWVLDCERHNKWLDEIDYAIDISTIPRGGHRRRKSMEPRSLSQHNGELFSSTSPRKVSPSQMSPTKEILDRNSPNRRASFAPISQVAGMQTPSTPKAWIGQPDDFNTPPPYNYAESQFGSPTTPYFLHPTQLVQQTCPPKQTQELFFPVSGKIEEHPDAAMRARLLLARRKSLQFAPKVGSPLSRRGDL